MIKAILVFNNYGKPRLIKFYEHLPEIEQQLVLLETFKIVSQRSIKSCNFIEKPNFIKNDWKIMYKHYATLYFVFCCDENESELAILDLIQVFVESLDKCFKNVCELDLIFHMDRAHYVLNEIVMGGIVFDTISSSVSERYEEQMKLDNSKPTDNLTNRLSNLEDIVKMATTAGSGVNIFKYRPAGFRHTLWEAKE